MNKLQLSYERLAYQEKAVSAVIDTLSGHDDTMNTIETDPTLLADSVRVTLTNSGATYPKENYLYPFPQFNIEMETGTGKTMVYLKTIMEIHRRFSENKFVIVVPSRAIKAGVEDSLNKLRSYLADVHNTDKYHAFVYDSKQISQLQAFAGSSFEIMLTTVQAFNSSNNVINQEYSEGFWGGRPLDQIREANPIVVIDEPQSVDGADTGKKAIESLNPKIVLRYSATHKDKQYPLLFNFGPVDAYNEGMVKHIETLGTDVNTDGNIPTVELKSVEFKNGVLQAKVVAYKETDEEFTKKTITLKNGDVLSKKTKNPRYESLGEVTELNSVEQFIEFRNGERATVGAITGENEIWLNAQLHALIKDHLNRELQLQKRGIKVLSLIFLDSVENYRIYTDHGEENGQYAKLFESIYSEVLHSNPAYQQLNDYNVPVNEVHDGYFAMDKATKRKPAQYRDSRGTADTVKDESAYDKIMTNKEALLTQFVPNNERTNTPAAKLRFIFSHSALKEGWDNPNVFQILTITTPANDLTRRQKIGRGLRISVNQKGERVYGPHNVVTIYANETFEEFASGLQDEYIQSGQLTNKIDEGFFAGMIINKAPDPVTQPDENGIEEHQKSDLDDSERAKQTTTVTMIESQKFLTVLKQADIVKPDGTPRLKQLKNIATPAKRAEIVASAARVGLDTRTTDALIEQTHVHFNVPTPTNRRERHTVELTDKNNEYFTDLWNQIAHKVNYHVRFSESELIDDIVDGDNPLCKIQVTPMTAIQTRARLRLATNQIDDEVVETNTTHPTWDNMPIMDVTRQIADRVGLTRAAIIQIIIQSAKIDSEFMTRLKQNPALFVRRAINNIQVHQRKLLNKSLVYVQSEELWSKDKFQPYEAARNTLWQVPDRAFIKTLYKQIAVQSKEEENFAKALAQEERIRYFLKLPNWFKIPTPFGNYNPDWAILAESDGESRLYFVVDTKTTREMGELSAKEQDRIRAGRQSYAADGFDKVRFEAPVKVIGDLVI